MSKTTVFTLIGLIIIAAALFYFYPPEESDLTEQAQPYCTEENVAMVEISPSMEYIKVTTLLLGGGSTYYSEGADPIHCPVVGPDAMSDECREMLEITDWEVICEPGGAPSHEAAEEAGYNFILDFIALDLSDPDQEREDRLWDALSQNARANVEQAALVSELAQFVGVQDFPDQGASVEDLVIVNESEAVLQVALNYSGGRVLRNIHLIVENGEWKVDRVSIPEEAERFDETGNLARNNPGLIPGVWYVVYEKPGQPALTAKLEFLSSSICAEGAENSTCDPDALTEGARVRILGEISGEDTVRVIRLEMR